MTSALRVQPLPHPPDTIPMRPREAEILMAVRHVFAEKGFDGASMQDLARAVGMSVGNFYRYFPSKDAMVEAMIRQNIHQIEQQYALLALAPAPLEALRAALYARVLDRGRLCEDGPIWAEVTAASHRKPELGAVLDRTEAQITDCLLRAIALAIGISPEMAARHFTHHARMMIMLVKLVTMDSRGLPDTPSSLSDLVLRQIDLLLAEITAFNPRDISQ